MAERIHENVSSDEKLDDENPEHDVSVDKSEKSAPSTSGRVVAARTFSVQKKLEVIEYSKKHSNHSASNLYNVDRKRIREWRRMEPKLKEMEER